MSFMLHENYTKVEIWVSFLYMSLSHYWNLEDLRLLFFTLSAKSREAERDGSVNLYYRASIRFPWENFEDKITLSCGFFACARPIFMKPLVDQ